MQKALNWNQPTVNRWVDQSTRFMRSIDPKSQRATIVRRPKDDGATSGLARGGDSVAQAVNDAATSGLDAPAADKGEGVQSELPIES
ncbi:MAG: hypothetical protein IKG11_10445 [Atopobiaceae bacterium]|nr:hypothetical protein [Atopobiaceae bacterium]